MGSERGLLLSVHQAFGQTDQPHELGAMTVDVVASELLGPPSRGIEGRRATELALAQQGVTEIHPWGSKPGNPEVPERIILDLDPAPDVKFSTVVEGAKELKKRLEKLGVSDGYGLLMQEWSEGKPDDETAD